MESDRLLEHSDNPNNVEANEARERGETVGPEKTSYNQVAILLLVLFCEPITAFMPMPFFAQVDFPSHSQIFERNRLFERFFWLP